MEPDLKLISGVCLSADRTDQSLLFNKQRKCCKSRWSLSHPWSPSLQRKPEALLAGLWCPWSLVNSLIKALLACLLSLFRHTTPGRVQVVPDLFHLTFFEATVLQGTIRALELVLDLCPDPGLTTVLSQRSTKMSMDSVAWHWS